MWGHRLQVPALVRAPAVSSRAPVWGASPGSHPIAGCRIGFKSCPRVGHQYIAIEGQTARSFKSCPRVGHLGVYSSDFCCVGVSSRASVWGASPFAPKLKLVLLFQVVPPCGGIIVLPLRFGHSLRFKSCPRVGASICRAGCRKWHGVSSRAPVWGHLQKPSIHVFCGRFKSCPRVGGHLPISRATFCLR